MLRRIMVILFTAAIFLFCIASVAAWFFLSKWVPTTGKELLIQELERRSPVEASIGTVRYEWPRDVLLKNVRVIDKNTAEVFFEAPRLNIHVSWLALALRKQVIFRAKSMVEIPCRTQVQVSGRFNLQEAAFNVHGRTEIFSLDALAPWLRKKLPPALKGGHYRLAVNAEQTHAADLLIRAHLNADNAAWSQPPVKAAGNWDAEATLQPAREAAQPWKIEVLASVHEATVDGIALAHTGAISNIEATLKYHNGRLTIDELTAQALESAWNAEASLESGHYEFLLSARRASLEKLLAAAGEEAKQWKADGTTNLRASCRGNISFPSAPDCQIEAALHGASVSGNALSTPIENINSRLRYDLLEKTLAIDSLNAQTLNQPLAVEGIIYFAQPIRLSLQLQGSFPLEAAEGWLPKPSAITDLAGVARLNLQIGKTVAAPSLLGEIVFGEARFHSGGAAITGLQGRIRFQEHQTSLDGLDLEINRHPLKLNAQFQPAIASAQALIPENLQVAVKASTPEGRGSLNGRLTADAFFIDDGQLAMDQTRLRIAGAIARHARQPSRLRASGMIALEELPQLPFNSMHRLETWKARGLTDIDISLEGPLGNLALADIEGRLRTNNMLIHSIPFDEAVCAFQQHRQNMQVNVPYAVIAGGKFIGNLQIESRQSQRVFGLQADLSGMQLEQLKTLVPAWQKRSAKGIASAHAKASGIVAQRNSWAGEGWVHAEGEELGDIPLLDKLFRGFFRVLADLAGGLDTLRSAKINQASFTWRLAQERIYTNDFRLGALAGTGTVGVYAKGSAGLDQTLDFVVEPELSEEALLEAPGGSAIASAILKVANEINRVRRLFGSYRLTGTIKEPKYRFEPGAPQILKEVAPAPASLLEQSIRGILDKVSPQQPKEY